MQCISIALSVVISCEQYCLVIITQPCYVYSLQSTVYRSMSLTQQSTGRCRWH